jgi:hypothetical protein
VTFRCPFQMVTSSTQFILVCSHKQLPSVETSGIVNSCTVSGLFVIQSAPESGDFPVVGFVSLR